MGVLGSHYSASVAVTYMKPAPPVTRSRFAKLLGGPKGSVRPAADISQLSSVWQHKAPDLYPQLSSTATFRDASRGPDTSVGQAAAASGARPPYPRPLAGWAGPLGGQAVLRYCAGAAPLFPKPDWLGVTGLSEK